MPAARTKKDDGMGSPVSDDSAAITVRDALASISESGKPKRKRQSQSCDACRARKVRCARENADDPHLSCKHCIALGIPCTYDYQPKKRGPPNLYLRRLQEAAAQKEAAANGGHIDHSAVSIKPGAISRPLGKSTPPGTLPSLSMASSGTNPLHTPSSSASSPYLDPSLSPVNGRPSSIPPSRYPIATDTFHQHTGYPLSIAQTPSYVESHASPYPHVSPDHGQSSLMSTSISHGEYSPQPSYPLYTNGWSGGSTGTSTFPLKQPSYQSPSPGYLPPLSYYYRAHQLEDVAPRERITLILNLFFDFVYPLMPCIHKPSFMADLQSRREERDPLFFALVMSTVAATLVQVPRSYLPMERTAVRRLAKTCHEASRHISVTGYDPPQSMHVVIRYLDTCYHFCEGHDATSHASFGEAAHIAVTLHMHEEASYEGLDPIECEMRRRTFWLLFGADKSMSILLGRPICLRDEDCTLHFPTEVDDEYITINGILPQPHGKTAIVSGLNYISRIFALLGEILVRIRVDKRSPPQGHFATARLEEIRSLHTRTMQALAHAPPPLRLKPLNAGINGMGSGGQTNLDYGGVGFTQATFAEVRDFFDNPHASRANASNAFLVMQGNLYVTQQLVRFVIEQYRDELVMSMRRMANDNTQLSTSEDREAVASDLLNVLHSIPIQSIATNGPSLVHKVRFVASTLLDAVRKAETAPASAARAHAYLWDFLSILSEIERNYLLDDDRDGSSNADGIPMSNA